MRARRILERHATSQHRGQRLRVDLQAIGAQRHIHAAGIPEARRLGNELVVGCVHEDLHRDTLAVTVQVIRRHPPHLDAAVVNGRADIERAQVIRMQLIGFAGCTVGDRGRRLQSGEVVLGFLRLAHVSTDEGTRQQRIDTRHAAQANARAHYPVAGIGRGKTFGALLQCHLGHHVGSVLAQAHRGHPTDDHVLVLHRRLARVQSLGGLEADVDGGTGLDPGVDHQRQAHQRGHDRYQPHQRRIDAWSLHHRFGQVGVGDRLVFVSHRSPCHPRSVEGRTSWRPAW